MSSWIMPVITLVLLGLFILADWVGDWTGAYPTLSMLLRDWAAVWPAVRPGLMILIAALAVALYWHLWLS